MRVGSAQAAIRLLAVLALMLHALAQEPTTTPPAQEPPKGLQGPQPAQTPSAPTPKVLSIHVVGMERYSEQQLLNAIGQKVGEPLDPVAVDRGIKTLWSAFKVHADAEVRDVPGGCELRFKVTEMASDREPRFIGNIEIDQKTLRKWALLDERSELFVHQANRVRQRLLEGYRREGFYWCEVKVVSRTSGEDLTPAPGALPTGEKAIADVIFEISEGPKVRVKSLKIRGNDSMPDRGFGLWKDGLSSYAKRQLSEPGLFNWWGSPFVEETLEADVLAMRNVYRDRGWLDAVVAVERLSFDQAKSGAHIQIVVDEGVPYTVASLEIEPVEWKDPKNTRSTELVPAPQGLFFPKEELLKLCQLHPGGRYDELKKNRDKVELREYYGNRGYLSHPSLPRGLNWEFLEPAIVRDVQHHTLAVTYRIVQGRRLTIREVLFAGTHHTRDKVLRREVSVFPGQAADLREINRSLARIEGTGYFSDQFDPEHHHDPLYRFVPVAGEDGVVDLEYQVEEGRVVEFNVTGGVDSNDGAFGLISLTMRNFDISDTPTSWWHVFGEIYDKEAFHGAGQRVDIELSPGTKVSRFRVHFLDPDIFNLHLKPISLDLDLQRRLRTYSTHDEDRFEKRIRFGRRFGFDTTVSLGYVHTDLTVKDVDDSGVPASLDEQDALGDTVLAGLTLDVSNRSLDNYLNPRQGYKLGFNNIFYDGTFGSDFEYIQSQVHWDYFHPTGEKADGTKPVMHLEFDAGVAQPYGNTDDVPYTERFFLGGTRTLRGFEFRGVGPRGVDVLGQPVGFAAGGETYLSGTFEWQYPLLSIIQPGTYKPIESLRSVLFLDWGVLDLEPFQADFSTTRTSIGFGVGLAYPFPILLNFGFPIHREDGDQQQTFSFSAGFGN